MRLLRHTSQFKRDYKRQKKRGKDLSILRNVISILAERGILAKHFHDHPLVGGYRVTRECHLEADWLLIYEISDTELILIRTGSHADLFE